MREILKNFDWQVYGASVDDIKYIIQTVYDIIEDRNKVLSQEINKIYQDNHEQADDIVDDFVYYKKIECYYLIEFLIIRLIGIFEGVIERKYLPKHKYSGYSSRIRQLKLQGFTLKNETLIKEWVDFRNALAHSPSEQYRPNIINREDIDELSSLLFDTLYDLEIQNKNKNKKFF